MAKLRRLSLDAPVRRDAIPAVHPLSGTRALVSAPGAIRRAIAAWSADQRGTRRPDRDAWREAIAVACAIHEVGGATLRSASADPAPWEIDIPVPAVPEDLAARAGLTPGRVRDLVDLLISAEALDLIERVGDAWTVRLRGAMLEPAPVAAQIAWDVVRARLGPRDTRPVALSLIREIARRAIPSLQDGSCTVQVTYQQLEDATGFGKTALRAAKDACEARRLLQVETRERVLTLFRLQPLVFGEPEPAAHGTTGSSETSVGSADLSVDYRSSATPAEAQPATPKAEPVGSIHEQRPTKIASVSSGHRAFPAADAATPGDVGTSSRMRVVRQDGVVILRVPVDVPLAFVPRPDGTVVPQVGDPSVQSPFTVELE